MIGRQHSDTKRGNGTAALLEAHLTEAEPMQSVSDRLVLMHQDLIRERAKAWDARDFHSHVRLTRLIDRVIGWMKEVQNVG